VDDAPYRLAYEASLRAVDDQARVLESVRTRSGTLFAATAIVTSFIGGIALTEVRSEQGRLVWHVWSFSAAAVGAFMVVGLLTIMILFPYRFRFSVSAGEIIDIVESRAEGEDPVTGVEAHRELALRHEEMYDLNSKWVRLLFWGFRLGILFLVLEVAAWTVVLWRGKA
jgi:hypothetical protein